MYDEKGFKELLSGGRNHGGKVLHNSNGNCITSWQKAKAYGFDHPEDFRGDEKFLETFFLFERELFVRKKDVGRGLVR